MSQSITLSRFFARRAFRIMPAYFVILAIYIFLPSWREYELGLKGNSVGRGPSVEVQSWQDYYRERWRW